jgi:hypothetical protein
MRSLVGICIIAIVIATAFASSNYADDKQFKGEIVGIHAKALLEELRTGKIENLAYDGKLAVMLDDGQKVGVKCPEDLLSDLRGCPEFSTKEIHGGFVASITIDMKEKQKVLLIRNQTNEWEVAEILK